MLLVGIPNNIRSDQLMEELSVRNRDPDVVAEEFRGKIRIHIRGGKGAETGNVIVEVSERVRIHWMVSGGVDILWRTHQVRDMSGVEMCYRCYGHGHGVAR